jgi:hypothetical protein
MCPPYVLVILQNLYVERWFVREDAEGRIIVRVSIDGY